MQLPRFSFRFTFSLLLISMVIASISCRGITKNTSQLEDVSVTEKDSIARHTPEWYAGSPSEKTDAKVRKGLKLPSLYNGFDSLQIRILIDCGYQQSSLFVLEKERTGWKATFYSFKIYWDDHTELEVRNPKSENRIPKSGWQIFTDSLLKTGIMDLPDSVTRSKDYIVPNDGYSVSVELATTKEYRIYEYPSMGLNTHIKNGPGKLHEALSLIEREFDFKRPCENMQVLR